MKLHTERAAIGGFYILLAIAACAVATLLGLAYPAKAASSQWTGCYVGAGGAYSMLDSKTSVSQGANSIGVDGLAMQGWGLYAKTGCDVELLPKVVVGAWGDYTWHFNNDFNVTATGAPGDIVHASLKNDWAVGGRMGYLVHPDVMPYLLVGYTQADLSSISFPAFPGMTPLSTPTLKGVVWGGGVDVALGKGWFGEAEYDFARYDTANVALGSGVGAPVLGLKPDVSTVRLGLAYKFNLGEFNAPPMK